ncbi:GntR family transcriptional regulator [Candidatus Synechococcus calcipolaris G9]|uniref:GntR family transcriptional regulator n=2 Tax=Synechococcus TaxID=1129 RepID=A0ABT6F098_9SYNE|nr:GntR family transcriptional regulator [Candidatus Synechococcus calcipolaris]MDG2991284.1 GntR family transcriptional regulator [Candidatus Synechococcus calcipolaris G9]
MVQFHIQPDSEIPASTQLFNQISFAIAARQFPPGYRLPSTRQLAMQTGLHRNTISKVYERLESAGLVIPQVGSGIYVRALGQEESRPRQRRSAVVPVHRVVQDGLDTLLGMGYSLGQIRELFLAEIDARQKAGVRILVTVPRHDQGAGELIVQELQQLLPIPVELVFLEELDTILQPDSAATLVTVRYFASMTEAITRDKGVRLFFIDIYSYQRELDVVRQLPKGSCLGLVSLSSGTLGVAEVMIHSLRGEDLLLVTAQVNDAYKLNALVHRSHTIISDRASAERVKEAIAAAREDLIRIPRLICCESYIDSNSVDLLKRELGLTEDPIQAKSVEVKAS